MKWELREYCPAAQLAAVGPQIGDKKGEIIMEMSLLIPATVSILLALLDYLFTYFNNLQLSQRLEKLERVNNQFGELYGPLSRIGHASDIAWR